MEEMSSSEINLPGFRFHPTEEELLDFYLKNRVFGKKLGFDIIRLLNIYHHDPWDLPGLAKVGEREWYFFVPRDRKHGSGGRPNRTTEKGFWKATGSERKIFSQSGSKRVLGFKKTLVFYKGRAPRGSKTDWIMNEYRLPDSHPLPKDIVLCKIYRKATSLKVLEQRAMLEEELKRSHSCQTFPSTSSSTESGSFCCQHEDVSLPQQLVELNREAGKVATLEDDDGEGVEVTNKKTEGPSSSTSLQMPLGYDPLPELQLPKMNPIDWTQDQLWAQFNSPWLQNWAHYANILNF